MGPLYKLGWFDFAYSLQMAGLIGFLFGFVLERAGFGNVRKLTAIFVCMLGLLYFSVFGWLDLGLVYLLPTYIWPQIAGGLILGIGFVMGGYCPTTSIVATVSGKLDGLIFIVGMIIGSFIFAEIFPLLEGFYSAGDMGAVRLPDVLNLNSGIIALLVCLMAVGAYWFVEKVEDKFGDRDTLPGGSAKMKMSGAAILILLGLILAIINPDRIVAERPAPPEQTQEKTEEIQKPTPKAEKPSSPKFEIVEDEGC